MSHHRSRTSRASDALVAHRPHDSSSPVAPQVERWTRVDPHTNAKSVYQRGPDGSEMYASYYNSNDDPNFQERFDKRNNGGAFVQTAQFTFMSHGGAGGHGQGAGYMRQRHSSRKEGSHRPVVVEEPEDVDAYEVRSNTDDSADVHSGRKKKAHGQLMKQEPIVEEPNENDDGYGYAGSRTYRQDGKRGERDSHRDALRPKYPTDASLFSMDPWGMESIMGRMIPPPLASHRSHRQLQLSPYTRGGVMGGPFTGNFFGSGGPESPFRMMDAMRYHMHQQRAAMFGGVDPFAHFF
ncbi:hypothetical protein GH5_07572 [Leishmania sp. Ghana 2012 LV757]|uniref:hypothetical protein n=1 Tax=Leishmania sp. Ghana 2012 LV757 TaxID=2803181 RepID=UPI001B67EE42|nr:hypothetical protein GH5_07572 [Leishmania sp. Ghana 2012 LV757]